MTGAGKQMLHWLCWLHWLFFDLCVVEKGCHVRADSTFSFKALRFEAPRHVADRKMQTRFRRKEPDPFTNCGETSF